MNFFPGILCGGVFVPYIFGPVCLRWGLEVYFWLDGSVLCLLPKVAWHSASILLRAWMDAPKNGRLKLLGNICSPLLPAE